MITLDFSDCVLRLRKEEDKTTVFDPIRKKWLVLTPEEHVRQYMLSYLVHTMHYPASLIAVEKSIKVGNVSKRYDIVVYNRNHIPWMLVECKAPEVIISDATLQQLLNYQRTVQCNYWLLTNGHQVFCADAGNVQEIKWMRSLPAYDS